MVMIIAMKRNNKLMNMKKNMKKMKKMIFNNKHLKNYTK